MGDRCARRAPGDARYIICKKREASDVKEEHRCRIQDVSSSSFFSRWHRGGTAIPVLINPLYETTTRVTSVRLSCRVPDRVTCIGRLRRAAHRTHMLGWLHRAASCTRFWVAHRPRHRGCHGHCPSRGEATKGYGFGPAVGNLWQRVQTQLLCPCQAFLEARPEESSEHGWRSPCRGTPM